MFKLPSQESVRSAKPNERKLTSHRLLTSDENINMKKMQKEERERKEREKEVRKAARELKKLLQTEKK